MVDRRAPPPAVLDVEGHAVPEPAPAPPTNGASSGAAHPGESIDEVTAAILVAGQEGVQAAAGVARELPTGAAGEVVLHCLPEDWRDDEARVLVGKLSDNDAALLLGWISRQWWEGYGLGNMHGRTGEDLRS